ncbi:hypothetical protein KHP62_07175 [Rhodobacteraceae bacterium NNCM2]|nr:hypothetical protein [Coraliihabitans acroporae]
MRRAAGLIALSLLAACAEQPAQVKAPVTEPAAAPKPSPRAPDRKLFETAEGPQVTVQIGMTGEPARTRLRDVAVNCWLDHVVGGAALFSDEATGRLLIVGETEDIVSADFVAYTDATSRIAIAGPAVGDKAKLDRMMATLNTAVTTGETHCG